MRKNKTYHITLPDDIISKIEELKEHEELKAIYPLCSTRSSVIALAVHQFYVDVVLAKKENDCQGARRQAADTP